MKKQSSLHMDIKTTASFFILCMLCCNQTYSADFSFDGFGSIGMAKINSDSISETNAIIDNARPTNWNANFDSRLGLQGSAFINDKLSFTGQVVMLGTQDYEPDLEWAYSKYQFNDALNMRLGILRRPFYANSEILHVGYAYDWIRPPIDVYSVDVRYFDDLQGIAFDYYIPFENWDFMADLYYGRGKGSINSRQTNTPNGPNGEKLHYEMDTTYGLALTLEKHWLRFRTSVHFGPDIDIQNPQFVNQRNNDLILLANGASAASQTLNAQGQTLPIDYSEITRQSQNTGENSHIDVGTFAILLSPGTWLINAEYFEMTDSDNSIPGTTAFYIQLGKRINRFTPHITYSQQKRKNDDNRTANLTALIDTKYNPVAGVFSAAAANLQAQASLLTITNPTQAAALSAQAMNLTLLANQLTNGAFIDEINRIDTRYFQSDLESYTLGLRYDFNHPISLKFEHQILKDKQNQLKNHLTSVVADFLF